MRIGSVLLAAALLLPALPAAAQAPVTLVSHDTTIIRIHAPFGRIDNYVELTASSGSTLVIVDRNHAEEAGGGGSGCATLPDRVDCSLDGVTRVYVELGDGNDILLSRQDVTVPLTVDAGPGNDVVFGGGGDDRIAGGGGADVLIGNEGIDLVDGEQGDDFVAGGAGPDDLRGGTGIDTVVYNDAQGPIVADLAGDRDDGEAGEGDVIRPDVENILGSRFNDRLTGSDVRNVLRGGGGRDLLYGLGGDDLFLGGTNTFHGGSGFDIVAFDSSTFRVVITLDNRPDDGLGTNVAADVEGVVGSRFDDVLVGSGRANLLRGGGGNDRIQGLDGDDVLIGDAGFDRIDGGPGTDTCRLGPSGGTLARCP